LAISPGIKERATWQLPEKGHEMQKTAYIISLKFAPGLKKEFELLGENIRSKGLRIKYLLPPGTRLWMANGKEQNILLPQ